MTALEKKPGRGWYPRFIVEIDAGWTLPDSARKKLLDIIGRECQGGEEFLEEIEHAVRMAGITQQQADAQSPQKVKTRLEAAAQAAEKFVDALFEVDPRGRELFRDVTRDDAQPMTVEKAIKLATETLLSLRAASNRARVGKGNIRKGYVVVLAASVAQALRNVGIEPKLWRHKIKRDGTETNNPYLACLEVTCQCVGGIGTRDLYQVARKGVNLEISSPMDAHRPTQTQCKIKPKTPPISST